MTAKNSNGRLRVGAVLAAVFLMVAGLTGCGQGNESDEDFIKRLADEPGVEDVIASSRVGSTWYQIRLQDDGRSGGICDVDERIRATVAARGDKVESATVLLGKWEWAVDVDAATSGRICGLMSELIELDAAFGGMVSAESGLGVSVIADAGEDLPDLFESVTRIVVDHEFDDISIWAYDLTARFRISTSDVAFDSADTLAAIRAATTAGAMTSYDAETTGGSSFWARTDADGAAITTALESAALNLGRSVVGSGVHVERGADEEAARRVWALVEPLDGVREARASGQMISVQTADVDTALQVQSLLTTAPEMQPYSRLGIAVDLADDFGQYGTNADRRLLTVWSAPGDVAAFAQTMLLTHADGVLSVDSGDDQLRVELEPFVDPADLAVEIRAAARPGQQVVLISEPFNSDKSLAGQPLLVFRNIDLLSDGELSGVADKKAFIDAWNKAAR